MAHGSPLPGGFLSPEAEARAGAEAVAEAGTEAGSEADAEVEARPTAGEPGLKPCLRGPSRTAAAFLPGKPSPGSRRACFTLRAVKEDSRRGDDSPGNTCEACFTLCCSGYSDGPR
jgi:hypothetical protein